MFNELNSRKFPLSLSQLNILNLERVLVGTAVNNISTTIRIEGCLDFPVLQKSIRLILKSDASLRTRLVEEDGTVLQYHAPFENEEFPVYDFSNTSKDGVENWEIAVTREPIALFGGPLYRFVLFRDSEKGGGVLVKLHHIIADGWTQIMLCNKIARTYLDLLAGKTPDLPEAPDYELHVEEEREYLQSKAFARDEQYWKETVQMVGEPSMLKSVSSAAISPVGRRVSFTLPEILNHAIYTFCEKNRVAPFAVFYMALAIYFKRNGGEDRFTIGVPIFNRTNYTFKQSTGMFVTTLPFFNEINDEWTFNTFNEILAERWLDLLRHQRYPFSAIAELANGGRLFNIALSYQDSKIYESRDASVEFSGRWHYCGYQAEQLTIHLTNLTTHRQYAVDYDYLAQFFSEAEIVELHHCLCHILSEALDQPDRPIHQLNILSLEQKEELLYTFNRTDRYLEERSVYRALIENNARHPNRAALIRNGERMTYGALFQRSMQFASRLSAMELGKEPLIAILLPRSFDLMSAMVGCLEMGGAYMMLSQTMPTERIKTILAQSGAAALITSYESKVRPDEMPVPVLWADDLVFDIPSYPLHQEEEGELPGDKLAYVVYTSGSTGEPKGVEITQRSLLNLAQEMETVYGQGAVLSVCNVGFDAFMLESIVALLNGKTIVLPLEGETDSPERLAALMNGYAVDFLATTPSRLSAFLQCDAFRKVMWRMESIVCGGEAFPPELLKKLKTYTQARIYNQYGPSEATVAVSMKEISKTDKITIGSPLGNCKLYVLDQWMNPLPIGGNGKLFVGGKCVGRGYRNRADLTEKAFRPNPFIFDDRIYDTGDMAYWTPGGEVVLTGRADRQVKLHGLRIELQEISSCIETYPGVNSAFAKLCDIGGQQVLGAYYTSDQEIRESDLLMHAATYLPGYMIPVFLLRIPEFFVTANGKIDESKLPLPNVKSSTGGRKTSGTAEEVTAIIKDVLENDEITEDSDYFLCGGNSLNMLNCILRIEERFGVKLRVADLYACRTAARLAELIDGKNGVEIQHEEAVSVRSLKKGAVRTEYPLTPIQQGIYVQSALDPGGLTYNMPGAFRLEKAPDIDKLNRAFAALIKQDPIFRTAFTQGQHGVVASVLDEVSFALEEISANDYEEACTKFLRPFDLSEAPLLRGGVWMSPEGEWYLFVDSHHIIGDGMSSPLVLQRLDRAYAGETREVEWNFYDYVTTREEESAAEKADVLAYWTEHLKDLPEPLVLPGDFNRPKNFDFAGGEWEQCISEAVSQKIDEFCRNSGYSEYVLFLSAYAILLSAVSGSRDMIIGSPVAGRDHFQSAGICGPFINTLPIRLKPDKDMTVGAWLDRVFREVADMLDHQRIGLEDIISALDLPRGDLNALYRVMLTQSPVNEDAFRFDGAPMRFRSIPTGSVKMDMILELAKSEKQYLLRFSYASSIFSEETIAFYGRCMEQILKEIVRDDNRAIGSLSLLSPQDQEKHIDEPIYRTTPFVNRPLHQLLKNKVMQSPDETAVIWHGECITYSTLEKRACAIARFLEENGVPAGSCIGLCLNRTPDMIAAMYGVLKAGCAYMFMLKTFPEARLRYMLEISNAALVLYDEIPQALLETSGICPAFRIPEGEEESYTERLVSEDDLVNVLFTSGSTGQPKGVMLRHRSVANLYAEMKTLLDPIEGRVLCSTNSVFDCFIVETLIALALGRCVVLADEEEMMLPWKLANLISTYQTGVFEMTPSRLWMCLGNEAFCRAAKHIRIVLLGGEVVVRNLVEKFYTYSDGLLMNMYGPTEATVFTTMGLTKAGEHITIGAPLRNTRTYVLDEDLRPVIPTGCGELYIAGECLAAGYISRPELTEESFVDDIYFAGQKMYKSGDLVRLRLDGRFDYIGRKDKQIKLNGQRVELSEIVGALESVDGITQAAVTAVKAENGNQTLCGFYVCDNNVLSNEEINAQISGVLPTYMVPSRLVRIESMPLTSTNKIDIQTLSEWASDPDFSAVLNPTVPDAPAEEKETVMSQTVSVDEKYVLSVWSKVLGQNVCDADASFFKVGGTSMAALNVLSHYYNDRFEMSLAEFYENPTVRGQAELLSFRSAHASTAKKVEKTLADSEKRIFVTGATGFFGIHLLRELLDSGENHVACLIRNGGRSRLEELLKYYFGDQTAETMISKIEVVEGTLTEDHFGLSEEDYAKLCASVKAVYHCAADVRHYAADETEHLKVNVGGTERVLRLASDADAEFFHMSTCSVSGDVMKDGSKSVIFTEHDLDIGQIWERNIYVKTKFMAEQRVTEAMEKGLRAKIFRLGRLVGRMDDGKFQVNPDTNAFYLFLQGIEQLGTISEKAAGITLDVMPVDLAAKQVLALHNGSENVYHIMNSNPPLFAEILAATGRNVDIVSDDVFKQTLCAKMLEMDRERMALVMNNWLQLEAVCDGIIVTNTITQKALEEKGMNAQTFSLAAVLNEFKKGNDE